MTTEITKLPPYKPPSVLTMAEIEAEKRCRIQERLGILCEDREPTIEQLSIAVGEADEWEEKYMDEVF